MFGNPVDPLFFSNTRFRLVVITTNLWKEAGWATIIYLAVPRADPAVTEAAASMELIGGSASAM